MSAEIEQLTKTVRLSLDSVTHRGQSLIQAVEALTRLAHICETQRDEIIRAAAQLPEDPMRALNTLTAALADGDGGVT